jgi:hypothetical protein
MYTFVHEYNISSHTNRTANETASSEDSRRVRAFFELCSQSLTKTVHSHQTTLGRYTGTPGNTKRPAYSRLKTTFAPFSRWKLSGSEEDYKAGRVTSFETPDDAIVYVSSLIKDDNKNKDTAY